MRESEVRANADYMAARLKSVGWQYVVVDIEWYAVSPQAHGYIPRGEVAMDSYGRFLPAVGRFPSAANGVGFKALADSLHGEGLKMGDPRNARGSARGGGQEPADRRQQVSSGGDRRQGERVPLEGDGDTYGVDMSKPGGQDYYDSEARLWASWGIDYVKADDMSAPYHAAEIHGMSLALAKAGKATGRPIVLSLSPGAAPLAEHEHEAANAQLWRISGDFWDTGRSCGSSST